MSYPSGAYCRGVGSTARPLPLATEEFTGGPARPPPAHCPVLGDLRTRAQVVGTHGAHPTDATRVDAIPERPSQDEADGALAQLEYGIARERSPPPNRLRNVSHGSRPQREDLADRPARLSWNRSHAWDSLHTR
jgi:hypothetical protein